jgi:ABC-type sugar transport system substrate-binding protein
MIKGHSWAGIAASLSALAWLGLPTTALAQEESGTKTAHELRADYDKDLKGKTIAFLPIATGVPLMDEWGRVIKTEAEWRGMKFIIRDPALNMSAMQQALTALVDQKPDVLIVQNPSVTLLMKELKRAESQGIHVIQMNMSSSRTPLSLPTGTRSDASSPRTWSRFAEPEAARPARCRSSRASLPRPPASIRSPASWIR